MAQWWNNNTKYALLTEHQITGIIFQQWKKEKYVKVIMTFFIVFNKSKPLITQTIYGRV